MKTVLIGIFSTALIVGGAIAQDAAPAGTPPPEPQTSTPAQPQTSSPSQTQTPQQMPETQTPASDPAAQSTTQQPAKQNESPQVTANASQTSTMKRVAPGSVIPVTLTKSIDAKKAKTGDEVVAKVTQDLKSNSGEVVFAKDTKVVGHVTEAQARTKEQKESQVGIMFDHAVTKTGEMPLPMSIQAVIGPQNQNSADQGQAGNETAASTPNSGAPTSGMGGSNRAQPATPAPSGGNPTATDATPSQRPQITGNTQGVVGISNLNLAASSDAKQGSVLTSDKNNVKLDSGTFMLLRVNQ